MKLLLTSKGITNKSIEDAFRTLLSKDVAESQIAFVTTAGYAVEGDKKWFVDQIFNIRNLNPRTFEIIEFNNLSREEIIKRLERSDAVFLSGGNSAALMHAIDQKDLKGILRNFAQEKLYCGISASSHIASKDLKLSTQAKVEGYYKQTGYKANDALGLIDFYIRAHYKAKDFPHITEEYVANLAKELNSTIYALDDDSALVVEDEMISIISEGEYRIFKPY